MRSPLFRPGRGQSAGGAAQHRHLGGQLGDRLLLLLHDAGLVPLSARLVDLPTAAAYLGVSLWAIRDLEAAGTLSRVRVPLPPDRRGRRWGGELRKLPYDRADLDRLIDTWKADSEAWMSRSVRTADLGGAPRDRSSPRGRLQR